jgi:TolB-like protein/DNA-binding winged helix-turn-helix (wHTH) protein/Flp pilus assembly protein TadD
MEGSTGLPRLIRFAEYNLDTRTGELRKGGAALQLHAQPLQVLLLLLEHPGEVVSRDHLRSALWPDDTFVDFEDSLNHAVRRLREALADSPENPHFIQTIPRHGYRFIYPIEGGAELAPQEEARPVWWQQRSRMVALVAGAAAVSLALLFAFNVAGLRERILRTVGAVREPPLQIQSIAVLPFENLSGDPAQEYFADGMTEELITDLGKISALRVISRTSVMRYKGSRKSLPEIARELNVDVIAEGAVQRSGNRVRITAQLIQALTDRHLWAGTYDRDLRDVLVLQSEVASAIGDQVQAKLTPQDRTRLASARSVNPEAYEAHLKARYFLGKWTAEGTRKCVEYSQRAIDLDAKYATAYAGQADCYAFAAQACYQSAAEAYPKAKAAAGKALELDDTLAETHAALGTIKFIFDWDWPRAEQELKRAVMLDPNSSMAHEWYGRFLTAMDRSDEAVRETKKALELDPLSPTTNALLGWVLYYARRYDESIAQLKKALELAPDLAYANNELGWNYAQERMYPEAVTECQRAVSLMPEDQIVLGSCGAVYGLAGRRQDARTLRDRLMKVSARGYLDPYNVAFLYDGLGDNDRTMEWLERAYRERSGSMFCLKTEIWTDRLRSDPRFQDLLRRMNFPP